MPKKSYFVAVISPERKIHEEIALALEGNTDIETIWTLADYPGLEALTEIGKATGGCVLFLDFTHFLQAKAVAEELDKSYPNVGVVALNALGQSNDLVKFMQLGIREVISLPLVLNEIIQALARMARKLSGDAEPEGGHIYAFLPAKPGVGATTLASYVASTAARLNNERTLLVDFDFRLGMTSFLLKLDGSHSVLDAISFRSQLDNGMWDRLVCRRGMLEVLGSAPVEFGNLNPESGAGALVDAALQTYQTICVDLPGEMREYEIYTLNLAKECFLVTSPDIGALHMARKKAMMLQSLGLQSKVSVIMNRVEGRGAMGIRDVEAILQLPVRFSVAAAERQIAEAMRDGKVPEGRSPLVRQLENIARRISPGVAAGASKRRQFIEMFSVSPVRDRARWGW